MVVLERQVAVGGNAISERFDGFLMEHGPSTMNAATSEGLEVVRELGLDYHALTAGPDASALQGALVLALVDTLDLARARIAAAAAA